MSASRVKAAVLAPLPPPTGGIGTWALRVKESMPPDECEIVLVDEGLVGGREFFGEKSKKKLSDEWRRCRRIWRDLNAALASGGVEIVHANIPAVPGGMLRELRCAQIAHAHKCKFIIHWHSTVSQSVDSPVTDALLRRICNVADAVIVLNEKSRRYVEARTDTPVYLLPNFVSDGEISACIDVRNEVRTCLYVGGVCEEKGINDFLGVARRFPGIVFKAIGKIEIGVADLAPDNAVLTGPLDHAEIGKEMRAADIFFFPTHYRHEGFSVALTEAMAAGLPCIATDWAANVDMLAGSGGAIVPPGDIEAGAKALEMMLGQEKRKAMSTFNTCRVRSCYTADRVLARMVNMYRKTLEGKASI